MALAQLDGASGQPVEKRGRARIRRRCSWCQDRCPPAAGRDQSGTDIGDFGLDRAGKNHTDRVEHHELGVLAHGPRDGFPRRPGDEVREFFDGLAHREVPAYFRGGVTPAGRGTCATFSVIDTRL